jgi:hypothetical protein
MRSWPILLVAAIGLATWGCSDDKPSSPAIDIGADAVFQDFGAPADPGTPDPGPPDPGTPDPGPADPGPADLGTPDPGPQVGICLLNNCADNAHCAGCTQDRLTCLVEQNRCVACNPVTQVGCTAPLVCSPAGVCAEAELICTTDPATGVPTIECTKNADCLACSPANQVCDTTTKKCQACTEFNTSHCLANQWCKAGACSDKCPKACFEDNDCARCGSGESAAKACFAHQCAECSDTYPCPAGQICSKGTCVPPCGLPDASKAGACQLDEDCAWCGGNTGDPAAADAWECKFPINGATYGQCSVAAAGCADIGSAAVLPAPYDQVTNLCSDDSNCDGIGVEYNIGALIKKLVGGDKIDLGFAEVPISDANVSYGMNACAAINITDNISCGLCVPCRIDADCAPIAVDGLVGDLFAESTLAQIAGAFLLDFLFGDNEKKDLNFFCQSIAGGYGACIPCGNPLSPCGTVDPGPGTGTCDHQVCETGTALNPDCGTCADAVCAADTFCCTTEWDATCVANVDKYCTTTCSGTTSCDHGPCAEGGALDPSCSPCTAAVCDDDPYCCSSAGSWDTSCAALAAGKTECAAECAGGCAHSECEVGPTLAASCSPCATAICAADSYCCDTEWDSYCLDAALLEASCGCAP